MGQLVRLQSDHIVQGERFKSGQLPEIHVLCQFLKTYRSPGLDQGNS